MPIGGSGTGIRAQSGGAVLTGSTSGTSTGTTYYLHPTGPAQVAVGVDNLPRQWVVPVAGTIRNFKGRNNVAPAAGNTGTVTIRKNAVNTALALTWANADGADALKSSSDTVSVVAGDKINMQYVAPAATTAVDISWSFEFDPA